MLPPPTPTTEELSRKLLGELLLNIEPPARSGIETAARAAAWETGNLLYKLHADQRRVLAQMDATRSDRYLLEIARRWGKSRLMVVVSVETCIRKAGARVIYVAPTLSVLREFILPSLEQVCADAPPELRGRYNASRNHWEFPNGSYIHLAGCDDKRKADRGRGPAADLAIIDEAGFIPILDYVIRSVIRPQLLHSGGRLYIASTPAEVPEHPFTERAERAEAEGYYVRRTIDDNPLLSAELKGRFIADDARDYGCSSEEYIETDEFRREHLAQRVVDKLLVVLPEWDRVRDDCIAELPAPEYFDAMTVLDFGGADPHAALFAYWDFQRAQLVVVDELLLRRGENTAELVAAIQAKERALWGVAKYDGSLRVGREDPLLVGGGLPQWLQGILIKDAPTQPYSRWCDNDIQLAKDMHSIYGLSVIPTRKDDLELQVHNLRVLVGAGKLVLHPRCVQTDRHFRGTTWENHRRHGFTRKAGEHGDLLAAGIYLARNVDRQRNPIPTHLRTRPTVSLAASARAVEGAKAKTPGIYQHTRLGQRLAGKR